MGHRARQLGLHRDRASGERSRSGRHPSLKGDLAAGLRGRVAIYLSAHGRRRTVQRLRAFRRGRPRRRAREVRRAQSPGAAAGKRGKPSVGTRIRRTSRRATGTRLPRQWPTTCSSTIAAGSSTLVSDAVANPKSRTCGSRRRRIRRTLTSTVIATRGQRLALSRTLPRSVTCGRTRSHRGDSCIVEIDADDRIAGNLVFDLDDIDAAFAELDARYLAGEAAAHAHTWSVVTGAYAAFNRRELPATTPDWVNIDHRRGAAIRARRRDPVRPCRMGRRARHQHLHRGCASAERPRSGRHPSLEGHLAAGLRRRVAGDRNF